MNNIEKARELYHKIGMEETMLSALCEMAEWKDKEHRRQVYHVLGCDTCKAIQCSGCVYYGIKRQLT